MSFARKFLATVAGLATAASGLAFAPSASANPAGTGLVISEAYLNGGSAGATYTNKFVEIYNPTDSAVDLTTMSVQYRSAAGTGNGTAFALTGSVGSHDYYVVVGGSNGANGSAVPDVDQTTAINPSGSAGTIYLATGTAAINPGTPAAPNGALVDTLGYGTSNMYEGTATGAASVTTSVQRDETNADTDVNADDFAASAPTPGAGYVPPPPPVAKTIAEIQGTDTATSPMNGLAVITTGVVTATYPTGGFNGFYLQTAGTGGPTDATPGASDALFVFGTAAMAGNPAIGDYVEVTGAVSEFAGLTEVTPSAGGVVTLADAHDPVTALDTAYPTTDADREAHEGELLAPTDSFVVTNNFNANTFGELGLATGDTQLWQPTDVADAQDSAAIAAVVADNAARGVILNDGASVNYTSTGNQSTPLPWLTTTNPARIGSVATLHQPLILDYRNSGWNFEPTTRATGESAAIATFSETRTANLAPQPVGGDVKIGALNVLNFFNTTGEDWVAAGGGHACTYFYDRDVDPVSDNSCTPNGPRGAAESTGGTDLADPDADLERQRIKIVHAINTLDADVVSLEEVENSVALGEPNRDDALASLVAALNADAGSTRWAYAPSPAPANLPDLAEQDVIRTAFIYNPDTIDLVGDSVVLVGSAPFSNAREPLAQAFKRKDALTADAFLVVANHFKSKGSGTDDGTGQGNANPDRVAQASALLTFADQVATDRGTSKVFLTGDFNSYTMEDPVQVIEAGGYTNLESDDPADTSYQFGGMAGSLDHVFANADALDLVTGFDQWRINAEESVGFEYSRYNYNVTQLWQNNQFRASDHNPELVGLDLPYTTEGSLTDSTVTPTSVTVEAGWVTIDSTVTGDSVTPTGTVEYWLGTTKLGESVLDEAGETTFSYGPFHSLGSKTVEVRYLGDTTHNASSDTVTFEVVKAAASVDVIAQPDTVEVRQGTTRVTVTVSSAGVAPTGTVEYVIDGNRVASRQLRADGTVEAELGPFASAGQIYVEAHYLGDARTEPASELTVVTVTPTASATTLSLSKTSVAVGSGTTTATATVSSTYGTARGSVDFLVDGDVVATGILAGGKVSVPLGPFDAVGSSTVEARYAGTSVLAPSSATAPLQVVKAKPKMTVTTKPATVVVKRTKAKVSVELTAPGLDVTGTVQVTAAGTTYDATLVDGKATVTLKPFPATGKQTVSVVYSGDDLNEPVSKTVSIKVTR